MSEEKELQKSAIFVARTLSEANDSISTDVANRLGNLLFQVLEGGFFITSKSDNGFKP